MPFTRPNSQGQDQDQCYKTKTKTTARKTKTKTKTKTEFCWSETGLATRPKSQTTSLMLYDRFKVYVCVRACVRVCTIYDQDHDQFVIQMLNGIGDYRDLRSALNPHSRPNFHRMTLQQVKDYMEFNGHCSALVKVLQLYHAS